MKITTSTKFALLFMATVSLAGCSAIKQMSKDLDTLKITTDPEVMEVHGDSISVAFKGDVPPKYFHKKGIIKFVPTVNYGEDEKVLDPFFIKGEDAELSDEEKDLYTVVATIKEKEGGSFEHNVTFPYKVEMKESELELYLAVKIDNEKDALDKCIALPGTDSITKGTITTSLTVKPTDNIIMGGFRERKGTGTKPGESGILAGKEDGGFQPEYGTRVPVNGYVAPEKVSHTTTFLFEINRAVVRASVKEGEEMKAFREFSRTSQLQINGVKIESYASPDGELELNADLTKERAASTFEYLRDELNSLGFTSVHDTNFVREATSKEDWQGFKRLVQESDISEKNEILDITNSDMPLDEKEAAIRKLDSWEPYMVDSLLPKLRRSEITVLGNIEVRELDTIRKLAKEHGLDTLNKKELLRLAYHSNSVKEKRNIYNHYSRRFPGDWIGFNNLAALYLFEGEYEKAEAAFEKYNEQFPDNPVIKNNLGVAYRHMSNYDSSRMNYTFASNNGINEQNNLGILNIKVGSYPAANSSFESNRCDYNTALSYVLNDQFEKGLEKIECIVDKTADVFYLRAIAAAGKEDIDLMTTSLRRAVEMDDSNRERAKNDLEFRHYWNSPEFKNALR